ncbi:EF-hand domain protein [soil metagenome]
METLTRLRATCILMFAALCLAACASGPPQDGPRGDWGKAPRARPTGDEDQGGPPLARRQVFVSPAGEPFRAEPGAPYPVAAWFAGADTNHDGLLTRDEFVADAVRFFAVVDTDHSGVIDGFEVSNYETRIAPEIVQGFRDARPQGPGGGQDAGGPPGGGRGGGHGGGRGPGGEGGGGRRGGSPMGGMLQGAAPYGLLNEPQPVMGADSDFDRRITRDEAIRAARSRFALLDTDGDAKLRLADLPRTPAQGRADGPPRATRAN